MTSTHRSAVGRRGFLVGAGGVTAAAALASCGTGGTGSGGEADGGGELPAYVEGDVPEPDLPGDGAIIEPGYTSYPAELTTTVAEPPGQGGEYTGVTITWGEPGANDSAYSTFLNEQIGTTLRYNPVPSTDYGTKIAAIMSGGDDLPDFVVITGWSIPPRMLDAYQGQFRDLTAFLGGDAVQDYPNLAAIPTPCWQGGYWLGQVAALPVPSPLSGFITFKRADAWDAAGLQDPTSLEELKAALAELTRPDEGRYAMASLAMTINRAFGLPLKWTEVDGEITHPWLSDRFPEALAFHKSLWDEGFVHPDVVNASGQDAKALFRAGKIAVIEDGHDAWRDWKGPGQNPDMDESFACDGIVPFSHDGVADPIMYSEIPSVYLTFISNRLEDDQVRELLGAMNYLAAPFGSVEYQNVAFGQEGTHFEMVDGAPQTTEQGRQEIMYRDSTVGGPRVTYDTAYPDWVQRVHAYQSAITPMAKFPRTAGLYVDLAPELASAEQEGNDTIQDILRGRKELSAWDGVVATWRDNYADQIKAEYEKALEGGA